MKSLRSVILCEWTVRIFLAVCGVSLFFIPNIAGHYNEITEPKEDVSLTLTIALYILCILAAVTLSAMLFLLRNIRRNDIFIPKNVVCLNVITVCLFVVGGICTVVAMTTVILFVFIAVAFLFMGVVLLVLRNVFSSAVDIKHENDLTI